MFIIMFHYVYEITNKINGKKYIGKHSTNNLNDKYMGSGVAISEAIKKYGIENFSKNILHLCDSEEESFKFELLEIEKVEATKNSLYYNIASGGKGGVASLWNDLEHRENMSLKTKKQWQDKSFKEKTLKALANSNERNKEKYRDNITGINAPWHKSVICLDNLKEFDTIKQACEKYYLNHTHISSCCRGKRKTTGKKRWMYLEDYNYCIENSIDFNLYKKEKYSN